MSVNNSPYMHGTAATKIEYNVYEENKVLKAKKQARVNKNVKFKTVFCFFLCFMFFFLILYRYSVLTEMNYSINKLNKEYDLMKNENIKLKIQNDKEMDLNKVKELAEKRLGMHRPDKFQIIYLKVPKIDNTIVPQSEIKTIAESSDLKSTIFKRINFALHFLD